MIPPVVENLHPNTTVDLARRIPRSSAIVDSIPMLVWFTTVIDCFALHVKMRSFKAAETIVKNCLEFFYEMDRALLKKISRIGLNDRPDRLAVALLARMKWPFLRPRMMLL